MEMRNKFINNARNVFNQAVTLLPTIDQLWYKYIHMEEMLGNVAAARQVSKRWMDWKPKQEWQVPDQLMQASCISYDKEEEEGIEEDAIAIVGKMRFQYEEEVRKKPLNYDSWFDYIRMEESVVGNKDRIRQVYERAIANVPPAAAEKRYWRRYIYLWISYATYEEVVAEDMDRTRDVYSGCLKLILHKKFSFAKIWLLAAQFQLRQKNLKAARQILGNAIGMVTNKHKIFKKYIDIELQLGSIHRCQTIYEKYLEWAPETCYALSKYAELERSLSEMERARAIFELAIAQPALDMPELLWKAYIDFEISEGEYERTRELYERLLDRSKHLKVWIIYAKFEASIMEKEQGKGAGEQQRKECLLRARRIFEKALKYFRTYAADHLKEETSMLLEEWLNMENSWGSLGDVNLVQKRVAKENKKKERNCVRRWTSNWIRGVL